MDLRVAISEMTMPHLRGPTGDAIDLGDLDSLADQGSVCAWHDVSLSATSMLDAATSKTEWGYEIREREGRFREAAFHEAHVGDTIHRYGLTSFPLPDSIPTAVEVVFCKLVLQGLNRDEIEGKEIWFFSKEAADSPLVRIVDFAHRCRLETFFHRNSVSIVQATKGNDETSRIMRHIQYSYENHAKKYGFLELFRALEMKFLENLLRYVMKEFFTNTETTLKKALDRLGAENKLAYNTINETGCQALAETIADVVNRARASGNTLATALYDAYERRSDKTNDKIWRGACYLFSLRCAIAHAGHSNFVYEDFSDGDELLSSIYGYFEEILLSIAGIRIAET